MGNLGPEPVSAPIYPEGGVDYILDDLDSFETREGDKFKVSEDVKRELREVLPWWEGKTLKEYALSMTPEESKEANDAGLFSYENMLTGGVGHFVPNYEKILQSAIPKLIPQGEELPEGWKKVKIRDIVIKTETRDPKNEPHKEFVYIDISSINKENFKIETPKRLTGKIAPSRARRIIKENDVIFSTNRPNLRTISIIPKDYDNQICSTGFCVLRSSNEIIPKFLFYLIPLSPVIYSYIVSINSINIQD